MKQKHRVSRTTYKWLKDARLCAKPEKGGSRKQVSGREQKHSVRKQREFNPRQDAEETFQMKRESKGMWGASSLGKFSGEHIHLSSGCSHKRPQPGWFRQYRCVFSSSGGWKSKTKMPAGLVLVVLLACRQILATFFLFFFFVGL
jgi:hypothetical protein